MAAVSPALVVDPDDSSRLCQFSKTKLCKFHVLGKCTKGMQCPFAHENLELRKLPDLRRTKLCKVLIQSGHCTSQGCMYAHSKEELRSTGAFHKTKLCRFMQTGHCTLGAKCNFAHSSVELREPETIEEVAPPPGLGGGWEAMIGGLLSDDDEEKENSGAAQVDTKGKDKNMIDSSPAYVPLPSSFDASSMPQKKERKAPAPVVQDSILNGNWDFQSQFAGQNPIGPIGMPPAAASPWDAANLAYGGAFHDWAGPWAGMGMSDPYASPLNSGYGGFGAIGGAWDYSLFGPSVAVDQMGDMKVKKQKPVKQGSSKIVRTARPSESGLAGLAVGTPEKQ